MATTQKFEDCLEEGSRHFCKPQSAMKLGISSRMIQVINAEVGAEKLSSGEGGELEWEASEGRYQKCAALAAI